MVAGLVRWVPLFFRGVVAYMDVGKEREQDAEALVWRRFLWVLSLSLLTKKVPRLRGETRNGQATSNR